MGSRAKVQILRFLCARPGREYTLRELSGALGRSLGTTVPSLDSLLRARIVTTRAAGRSRLVRLNERHPLATALMSSSATRRWPSRGWPPPSRTPCPPRA